MEIKYLPLLKLLFEKSTQITSKELAEALGISVRTVKSYIHELNEDYPGIIVSSPQGYLINTTIGSKALKEKKEQIPQTARERAAYVIIKVLKNDSAMSVYDICEELFISISTFRTLLPRIKSMVEPFGLQLVMAGDDISICGMERNKRKLLSSFLYHESNENFVNLEAVQNAFLALDIDFIKQTVLDVLNEYHYFINDYSLSNLVLHFAIAIDRIQNHYAVLEDTSAEAALQLRSHEYELSNKVIQALEQHFSITFSSGEIYEMALLLISRSTSLDFQTITVENLESFIGKDSLKMIRELLDNISSYYFINLYEPEFFVRFALHIKNLLIRAKNECFSKNPLTNNIKTSCPLIYDSAVEISMQIKEKTGLFINEDEIAYIAFHIGSALEAQKELASRLSTVIYCPAYYNMGKRLYETLNQRFATKILIANIATKEEEISKIGKCDFIISTVPFNTIPSIPYVQVQPFLSETDIAVIYQTIEKIDRQKKQEKFSSYLRQLVLPDFFEHSAVHRTQKEVIHYLCKRLADFGYVQAEFETEVLEREEMSSTAFGNFAIPHAMKMKALKTGMYIYISDTPVDWNGTPVSLIIMLCFNREERYIFNEIFEPLTMVLTEGTNIKKLLTLNDYTAVIDFLSEKI